MKNIILAFTMLSAIMVSSCKKIDLTEVEQSSQSLGSHKITANIGESTKVSVDGVDVTWSSTDMITFAEIGDGIFVNQYYYQIDSLSISDDGKEADFYNVTDPIVESSCYIAVSELVWIDVNGKLTMQNSSVKEESEVYASWIMTSPIFVGGSEDDGLYFEHRQSMLNLDIAFDAPVDGDWTLTGVEILSSPQTIVSYAQLDVDNVVVPVDETSSLSVDETTLFSAGVTVNSGDSTLSINIPITVIESLVAEGDVTFNLTFENVAIGGSSVVTATSAARAFESG